MTSTSPPSVAYVLSRFPVLTQTFILDEILALQARGWPIEVFALHHQHERVVHAAARSLEPRVHFPRLATVLHANRHMLAHRPNAWQQLLGLTIGGNLSAPTALAKSLLVVPMAVAWAHQMQTLHVGHVHAHFGTYPALAALIAARLQGIGYSFTVHAHDLFADNQMLAEKVRQAKFVITISEYNRDRLFSLLADDAAAHIRVVHCGIDVRAFPFNPTAGRRHGHTLLTVAALRDYKGLEHLVRACVRLRTSAANHDLVCYIVGDGPLRKTLERQIRASGVEDAVVLLGAREQSGVRELLERADVFVLPSVAASSKYMDGVPVALMEAMASGVPVVASRLSGIPELVRDNDTGLLVQPGNADELCDAIMRCWRDPAASRERARRARALVEREYNVHETARQLGDVFACSLGEPSHRSSDRYADRGTRSGSCTMRPGAGGSTEF